MNKKRDMSKINQLFDKQFVLDIVTSHIVAYLIDLGYEDEDTIDHESILLFIKNNFDFITKQVIKNNLNIDLDDNLKNDDTSLEDEDGD